MQLLFVIPDLTTTGAGVALLEGIRALVAKSHLVAILPQDGNVAGELAAEFRAAGAAVERQADPNRFDAVVICTLACSKSAPLYAARRPTLWWIHEGAAGGALLRANPAMVDDLVAVDRIMLPSAQVAASVYKPLLGPEAADRFRVVPYGVAVRGKPPDGSKAGPKVRIVAVGAVGPRNRQADLIAAVRRLGANGGRAAEIECVIVGGILPEGAAIRDQAAAVPGLVRLTGALPPYDVHALLRQAGIFCSCSADDSFAIAPLEAALYRAAPVLTDIEAHREVWRDGESALLYPVGDVEALSRCIATLVNDAALRARIGEAAEKVAAQYTRKKFALMFEIAIRDAIEAFSTRGRPA